MKKVSKILTILMIAVLLIGTMQTMVAADAGSIVDGVKTQIKEPTDTTNLQKMAGRILGIIQVATVILAVILVAIFGFKFVLGSAQEKADYQKSFIPLIVGVVVVFAATTIAKLIMNVATSV